MAELEELGQQLRVDSIRASDVMKSGHPTSSMSAADLMAVLFATYLRYERRDPGLRHHRLRRIVQDEIAEEVSWVVKMNLDSNAQYASTRAVADHMFVNYVGVVYADCGIGDKRAYNPRTWDRSAEEAMAARVVEACHQLGSAGRSLTGDAPRPRRA